MRKRISGNADEHFGEISGHAHEHFGEISGNAHKYFGEISGNAGTSAMKGFEVCAMKLGLAITLKTPPEDLPRPVPNRPRTLKTATIPLQDAAEPLNLRHTHIHLHTYTCRRTPLYTYAHIHVCNSLLHTYC